MSEDPLATLREQARGLADIRFAPEVAHDLAWFTQSFQLRAPVTYAAIMTDAAFDVLAALSNAALLKVDAVIHPLALRGLIQCLDVLIEEVGLEVGDE